MMQIENCCNNTTYPKFPIIIGNLVPHNWFSYIKSKSGRTDHSAISIFSEIVYWYKPNREGKPKFKDDIWQTSYEHFETRFGYNKQKIRRALVRLEELGLIQRELRTIEIRGYKYSNVLFIRLASSNLKSLTNSTIVENKKICISNIKYTTPSIQNSREHYKEEENTLENNRSRSNFKFNESLEKAELKIDAFTLKNLKRKKISELLPIDSDTYNQICLKSVRKFNISFVNELAGKLALKYPEYSYPNKSAFITYMVKALDNELLTEGVIEEKAKKEAIKNKSNDEIDEYLSLVKYSSDKDIIGKLKQRMIEVLSKETAYNIFKNCKFPQVPKNQGKSYILELERNAEEFSITEKEKNVLLEVINEFFGNGIKIENIEFYREGEGVIDLIAGSTLLESEIYLKTSIEKINPTELWRVAKRILRNKYGNAICKAWFDKLEVKMKKEDNLVEILAQTNFIKDWTKTNYYEDIKKVMQKIIYQPCEFDIVSLQSGYR